LLLYLNVDSPIAACSCFSDAGLTCLQTAVAGGDLKMLKILLQQGEVNAKSRGVERTALMMACAAGKVDVVKMLLENGALLELTDRCEN
jgi:ankyrin repeat protein